MKIPVVMFSFTLMWAEWLNPAEATSTRNIGARGKYRLESENIGPKHENINPNRETSTREREHRPET
ncbi:hypothetical protein [Lentibacillus sp. Marseille-P4043]|uniref:hypothetical protein n=1 Tax=Lentibacillus sp. Marseille-P4043 TaxID=2040293 RepID=UPI00131A5B97|nr:hypothetical protein [Lentibacillus sp. Marseille-P4043]